MRRDEEAGVWVQAPCPSPPVARAPCTTPPPQPTDVSVASVLGAKVVPSHISCAHVPEAICGAGALAEGKALHRDKGLADAGRAQLACCQVPGAQGDVDRRWRSSAYGAGIFKSLFPAHRGDKTR